MNKIFLTFAVVLFPAIIFASPVQFGRVVDIKGSGFISYEGQTHEIKKGEVIYTNSEIVIEHSGQVVFTDNADHRFYLGNASSVAVFAGKVELRSGDVWVQSLNKTDDYQLTSANATVNYTGGEAIFSYDSVKGKTQLMVINGLMKFSNLRSPELNLNVAEGNFSFVDPSFEGGMPRDPTPVGAKTYGQLVSMFPGVTPMDKRSADIFTAERGIASVPEVSKSVSELEQKYKNKVMNMAKKDQVTPASSKKVEVNLTKTTANKKAPVASELVIKIYGLAGADTSATTAIYDITAPVSRRAPASVSETVLDQAVPTIENMNTIPATPQYKESEKLIDQLNKL